ncbi:hypothetical protein [Thioclava nitratireducens]|uniref:hypothetical protein n=1 Tax=Thioclava nitratireducens TaxID=1915078 RepID=UPI001FCB9031|nr:hypothetical protein [Thioclava nitratireducens]
MNIWLFTLTNLIATIPKSLAFVALGYWLGSYYGKIDSWLTKGSIILLVLILFGGTIWLFRRKRQHG